MTKSFDDDDTKEPDLYQIYETHFGDPKTASETGRLPGELFGKLSDGPAGNSDSLGGPLEQLG